MSEENEMEKTKWIFENIGALPYNLVKNNNNKSVRIAALLITFFWLPIVLTPFIPYFIYDVFKEIFKDA